MVFNEKDWKKKELRVYIGLYEQRPGENSHS